jgi:hypothetical protein
MSSACSHCRQFLEGVCILLVLGAADVTTAAADSEGLNGVATAVNRLPQASALLHYGPTPPPPLPTRPLYPLHGLSERIFSHPARPTRMRPPGEPWWQASQRLPPVGTGVPAPLRFGLRCAPAVWAVVSDLKRIRSVTALL